MTEHPPKPTPAQCAAHATLSPSEYGRQRFAAWHPQWGGYTAPCVVEYGPSAHTPRFETCFDVWVWHDGEFVSDSPRRFHYCDPGQLIAFGKLVSERMGA
jgi:hypothetical protein